MPRALQAAHPTATWQRGQLILVQESELDELSLAVVREIIDSTTLRVDYLCWGESYLGVECDTSSIVQSAQHPPSAYLETLDKLKKQKWRLFKFSIKAKVQYGTRKPQIVTARALRQYDALLGRIVSAPKRPFVPMYQLDNARWFAETELRAADAQPQPAPSPASPSKPVATLVPLKKSSSAHETAPRPKSTPKIASQPSPQSDSSLGIYVGAHVRRGQQSGLAVGHVDESRSVIVRWNGVARDERIPECTFLKLIVETNNLLKAEVVALSDAEAKDMKERAAVVKAAAEARGVWHDPNMARRHLNFQSNISTTRSARPRMWPKTVRFGSQYLWDVEGNNNNLISRLTGASAVCDLAVVRKVPWGHPCSMQKGRDFGLYAVANIDKGTYILPYIGRIRKEVSFKSDYEIEYKGNLVVDAADYGNEARMINSADYFMPPKKPNVEYRGFHSLHTSTWVVGIFAIRKISAGEELLVTYGRSYYNSPTRHWMRPELFAREGHATGSRTNTPSTATWSGVSVSPSCSTDDTRNVKPRKTSSSSSPHLEKSILTGLWHVKSKQDGKGVPEVQYSIRLNQNGDHVSGGVVTTTGKFAGINIRGIYARDQRTIYLEQVLDSRVVADLEAKVPANGKKITSGRWACRSAPEQGHWVAVRADSSMDGSASGDVKASVAASTKRIARSVSKSSSASEKYWRCEACNARNKDAAIACRLCTLLRPASSMSTDDAVPGARVLVYWPGDAEWFHATIRRVSEKGNVLVKYDDGDTNFTHLNMDDFGQKPDGTRLVFKLAKAGSETAKAGSETVKARSETVKARSETVKAGNETDVVTNQQNSDAFGSPKTDSDSDRPELPPPYSPNDGKSTKHSRSPDTSPSAERARKRQKSSQSPGE